MGKQNDLTLLVLNQNAILKFRNDEDGQYVHENYCSTYKDFLIFWITLEWVGTNFSLSME